jgi:hypothetical protein
MENAFGLAWVFGRVFPGRSFDGAPGSVVLRLARTAVLLTLFATSLLTVFIAASSATNLPDGRGYELVSPGDKNGGDVIGDTSHTHAAAADGVGGLAMGVVFASLSGFSDVHGTGVSSEYMSVRDGIPGTSGWSTHSITPVQPPLSFGGAATGMGAAYESELSPDLQKGVLQTWAPLNGEPNVAGVENLYLRSDLRSPGLGRYLLLSDCSLCDATSTPLPTLSNLLQKTVFAGASADFSHVVFESPLNLTVGATGSNFKLYEAIDGVVRLLSVPGNPGCSGGDPCSAAAQGAEANYAPHVISTDGSRVVFVSPVNPGADRGQDGAGPEASKIFEFDDHGTATPADDTTTQVNASELTDCAGDPTCGGNGVPDPAPATPLRATYWDASADGGRVFFTTSEQLTDDTPPGQNSPHLYMWSATADAQGHHLTLLDADRNPADSPGVADGVIGASDDGHYVYFVADGQIVDKPGLPLGHTSIYLWRDDGPTPAVEFVGYFAKPNDENGNLNPQWSGAPKLARVTPDGKHLLFETSDGAGLIGYDHGTCSTDSHGITNSNGTPGGECSEAYVYSADSHELVCASCNPSGAPATKNVFVTESGVFRSFSGLSASTPHLDRAISDDGRRVFFSTAEALVPEDVNGLVDAYEYDVPTHTVHLISTGTDVADSWFMDSNANGNDAFFVTQQQLVGWDHDESYDLYDARVGGGFPEPVPVKVCSGDACRGQISTPPAGALPSSTSFSGAGNLKSSKSKSKSKPKPKPRCRRGLVRRRVKGRSKCVMKPARHSAHKAPRVRMRRAGK